MSDMDERSKMAAMRRKQRHMAEDRSLEFRALQAERARLRTALEEIVHVLAAQPAEEQGSATGGAEALGIARRALDEHP